MTTDRGWWAELRRRKVVRVALVYLVGAWLAIQVAGETFAPLGLPEWTVRLVIVLAALGLPLAIVLAWAFDLTPQGLERTPPPATAPVPVEQRSPGSLAILPFTDMSPERDQDYFCEGIAEEIINSLCCMRELKIASRTSAFQYKGRQVDVRAIGRELGVDTVLEGSVRKSGARVRITAQLIDARNGYHLWSETFDRRLEDVFAIQTEIAQQIARALRMSLTSGETGRLGRGGTTNPDAYELYLRGRALLRDHTDTTMQQAAQMFRRSIELDPRFALAHAGLAAALASQVYWQPVKDAAEIARALECVRRADELEKGLPEVMMSRALLMSAQSRHADAVAAFEQTIAHAPGLAEAYYWYARHCYGMREYRRAAELFERSVELDPANYKAFGLLGNSYDALGESERARKANEHSAAIIDHRLDLYPDDAQALHFGASIHANLGHRERALEVGERALQLRPNEFATLYNVACAYARLGENDRAIDLLERAAAVGWGSIDWFKADPDLNSLRSDPRFAALITRMEQGGKS